MDTKWEIVESGPADAPQTVLLLPGGMCSARSYAEVMAEPSLAGVRLIAATMPGHAGAPPPDDFSPEHYVQITAELAKREGVDVIVGFSMGAQVAFNMVVAGAFAGPVVLTGISLSSPDEPLFFRATTRDQETAPLPFANVLNDPVLNDPVSYPRTASGSLSLGPGHGEAQAGPPETDPQGGSKGTAGTAALTFSARSKSHT